MTLRTKLLSQFYPLIIFSIALVKQLFLTLNVLDGMSNKIEKNPNPNIKQV